MSSPQMSVSPTKSDYKATCLFSVVHNIHTVYKPVCPWANIFSNTSPVCWNIQILWYYFDNGALIMGILGNLRAKWGIFSFINNNSQWPWMLNETIGFVSDIAIFVLKRDVKLQLTIIFVKLLDNKMRLASCHLLWGLFDELLSSWWLIFCCFVITLLKC